MPMKVLPYMAIFTFVAGLSLLVVGYAFSNGESNTPATPVPVLGFDIRATETATPTASPTNAPTATPTPLPFDGTVANMAAPSLGINHPIEEIGITNNQLDTPKDGVGKVGWYHIYDKPGWGGNALFAAHVNYNFKQGPFANLYKAKEKDQITIQMLDGPAYVYEVFYLKRYDVNTIPMGDLIEGVLDGVRRPEGEEWITLITCGGRFQQTQENGLGEYLDRDVVVARRIQ
ncbi:MAG: class F sortase [Dehalococcoidia bacterium]|nr:class F sortase [Dehalococcoidia bacterium]